MDYLKKISIDIELHSVEGIRNCFENGVNPNAVVNDKPLIYELINMYTRGPNFKECIKTFIGYGLVFEDKILLSVLANDDFKLDVQLQDNNILKDKLYTLDGAFTPLYNVSLLHLCAEYNHLSCAKVLIKHGANLNFKAGIDEYGFGGQTPIFHTVNQDANKSLEVLKYFVSLNVDLDLTVKGLIWGKGYEWETFIPSVNPISYAMMGLLRQFQRTEVNVCEVVSILLKSKYNIDYFPGNIPNKYLNH